MSDSSRIAKGGLLMGIAAVLTAVVPLFTNKDGEKAEKADDKAELVMALINQHLEFLGKEVDELKENDRDFQKTLRWMMRAHTASDGWIEAPTPQPEPEPRPPRARARSAGGGSGAAYSSGSGSAYVEAMDMLAPYPEPEEEEIPEEIQEIIEEEPKEAPIQQQAPLPSPDQLDALLSK